MRNFIASNRDAFCLFYDVNEKKVAALNGSGHSPKKLTIDHVRSRGIKGNSIPLTDLNSVTVPGIHLSPFNVYYGLNLNTGAAAAWVDAIEKFGSGKLTIAEIFEPAIRLAEEGSDMYRIFK